MSGNSIGYKYTLTSAVTNTNEDDGRGEDHAADSYNVSVTTVGGTSSTSTIQATALDDAPVFKTVSTATLVETPSGLNGSVSFTGTGSGAGQSVSTSNAAFVFGDAAGTGLVHLYAATAHFANDGTYLDHFTNNDSGKSLRFQRFAGIVSSSTDHALPGTGTWTLTGAGTRNLPTMRDQAPAKPWSLTCLNMQPPTRLP